MKNDETLNPRKSKPSESNKPKVVFTEIGGISPRNIRMWTDLVISVNSASGYRIEDAIQDSEPPDELERFTQCLSEYGYYGTVPSHARKINTVN
jgi:hypothetical protein